MTGGQAGQIRLSPTVEWRDVEGEIVAVNLDRSVYLAANESGAVMWRLVSKGTTRDALVESLAETYGLERLTAERDVNVFLSELDAQDCLLHVADP